LLFGALWKQTVQQEQILIWHHAQQGAE